MKVESPKNIEFIKYFLGIYLSEHGCINDPEIEFKQVEIENIKVNILEAEIIDDD